jgi:hypothetical protein
MPSTVTHRRAKRGTLSRARNTCNQRLFHVIYVWGAHDTYTRRHSTYGRREALRYAKELAQQGAKIVLLKKGTFDTGMKLIADFSTVGGA